MLILSLRTDKPEAEIGLYDDLTCLQYTTWQAHRALAETLHTKIQTLLKSQGRSLGDIAGLMCYRGPGRLTSFVLSYVPERRSEAEQSTHFHRLEAALCLQSANFRRT